MEQERFQQSDYFREKSGHRCKIEAKNSELKNVHGYDRANSYGLGSENARCNSHVRGKSKKNTKILSGNTVAKKHFKENHKTLKFGEKF